MSRFSHLPTLGEMQQTRRAPLKVRTRLPQKTAERKADQDALATFRRHVFARDKGRCRCCGRVVRKTLELAADRAEVHHLAGRADHAVRYDRRNGILTCLACHQQITDGTIQIAGAPRHLFSVNGTRYLNGDHELRFLGAKA